MWILPKVEIACWAACWTETGSATSQTTPLYLRADPRQVVYRFIQRIFLDVGQHHLAAGLGEGASQGQTDSAGGASHKRGFPCKVADRHALPITRLRHCEPKRYFLRRRAAAPGLLSGYHADLAFSSKPSGGENVRGMAGV
jgi:hypothetical protein